VDGIEYDRPRESVIVHIITIRAIYDNPNEKSSIITYEYTLYDVSKRSSLL
jgi:hypothetical protein